jgi:hypothetical protein
MNEELDRRIRGGVAALESQDYDRAIAELTEAMKVEAGRPDVLNLLGNAHLLKGEVGTAVDYLGVAFDVALPVEDPQVAPMQQTYGVQYADALTALDRVPEAEQVLRKLIARFPDAVDPQARLAQLLLASTRMAEGLQLCRRLSSSALDAESREAAAAVAGATQAFLDTGHEASIFLEAHRESYVSWFDEVVGPKEKEGWYAEAARMSRGPDGNPVPIVADGARPWALTRIDLVDPRNGQPGTVYADDDPMIVGLQGFEPLAQTPVLFKWDGAPLPTWISSRCPWHWLAIHVQFASPCDAPSALEPVIAPWYLEGYNGSYGTQTGGRFHYATDLERIGDRGVSLIVDLGRARLEAIPELLKRLSVLSNRQLIERVIIGEGRLP